MVSPRSYQPRATVFTAVFAAFALALILSLAMMGVLRAQSSPSSSSPPPPQQQEAPPEAGGPQGTTSPVAVPKKKEEPPPPPKPKVKNPEGLGDYSLQVAVPLVNLDVLVTTHSGEFIPGLQKEHFRISDD